MPIKLIHTKEKIEQKKSKNNINFNIEDSFNKTYCICSKIIESCFYLLNNFNLEKILQINDNEEINEEYERMIKINQIFSIIFGKKYSIIDAITKATDILNKIQTLSGRLNINLINENEEKQNEEIIVDEDIEFLMQAIEDYGREALKNDIRESIKQTSQDERNVNEEQSSFIDTYKVSNEKE